MQSFFKFQPLFFFHLKILPRQKLCNFLTMTLIPWVKFMTHFHVISNLYAKQELSMLYSIRKIQTGHTLCTFLSSNPELSMFLHKKYKDQIIIAQTEQQNDNMIPIQPPPPPKKNLVWGEVVYICLWYVHAYIKLILFSYCRCVCWVGRVVIIGYEFS